MTANLLHDYCDPNELAGLLERVDPDVLVTQELGPVSAEVVAAAFPNHYLDPALNFTGRGIATKLEVRFGDIDMPGRDGTAATVDAEGTRVRVAGVHFLNPIVYPWWDSVRSRRRQLEGLSRWLDDSADDPVVVAGDFNASPRWPVYRRMAARLTDLVAERARREGLKPERTWAWRPGWPRLLRIDHVFGRGVQASHVAVHRIEGSDHAAVVADIGV